MSGLASSGGPLFMGIGGARECAFVVGGWAIGTGWCVGSVTCGEGCCGTGDCSSSISPLFGILVFCAPDVHNTAWLGGEIPDGSNIPAPPPFFLLYSALDDDMSGK